MTTKPFVNVIGAGLAGSEAAWQIAKRGVDVHLYEMRPVKMTPAHHTEQFAELVCTNSLRANQVTNAAGLIKEEMRRLDSIIIAAADENAVPAGGALAVDRTPFSQTVTDKLANHERVTVHHEELTAFPEGPTVVATGPLTSPGLAEEISALNGSEGLYFYDAAAPILDKNSIDFDKVYLKSRYDKGEAAYLNCPMTEAEFEAFYKALISAEVAEMHDFEDEKFFDGCMPIEVMAKRGIKTMLFGPLKPVGLENPKTR
ncbi:Hypotehtical protein, GidA family (N-terminal fragment) [Latilactobacillus sakei subsp. sakei 23K]|nr:Hypotehtical protein, GidA family (N-terminal fragment) [Latilactobacillus sakei subsp. sakei 23K]